MAPQGERDLDFEGRLLRHTVELLRVLPEFDVFDKATERIAFGEEATAPTLYGFVHVIGGFSSGIRLGQQVL